MATIENKYEMPDDLYYTTDHAWVKVEGSKIRIGITDFMQQLAGEITFIRIPRVDKVLEAGKTLASLQSGKWAGKILVPMKGKVVEVNKDLASNPRPLNEDPYGAGWIAVMEPEDLENGLKALLYGEKAVEWVKEEIAKHAQ
ncbi:MAG TPA: glycine cleavage system protein H [Syntrophomonadaceae bacterium]|nr:glycine cleavage system protein H [Syntrophomonadaceae bacterium]HOQ10203.1 glycine cleavage system protein H [Syntrophomonadaceae bacterium]HPU49330.1 glycine cleavage system protein H [Syntrophomonadaceae bacterium]